MAVVHHGTMPVTELQRPRNSDVVTEWFRPASQNDVDNSKDILKQAYEKAMLFQQEQSKGRRKSDLEQFFESTSMKDVLHHVEITKQQNITQKDDKSRFSKAMASGWTATVSRIHSFGSVIDVLVSTHPEYAAPVWGTIKFLITATLRHQELSTKVAEAFAAITNALPELEFLANHLYPVPRIQETFARMYAHIIDFCVRALKWYHKANSGFFRKTIAAIKDPWALEFEDVVSQIKQTTDLILKQADIAHKAETRHINTIVSEFRSEFQELRNWTNDQNLPVIIEPTRPNSAQSAQIQTLPPSPELLPLPVIPFQLEAVVQYLEPIEFDPAKTLSLGTTLRDRRRARGSLGHDQVWASTQLRDWISEPGSALVQLEGSVIATDASKDFALDMIELVLSIELPLAWYIEVSLPSASGEKMTVADVFRSLIKQILDQNKAEFENSSLTVSKFSSCTSEEDWLGTLVEVIGEIPQLILILDSRDASNDMSDAVRSFWDMIHERQPTTAIKMLLLTYPAPGSFMPDLVPDDTIASLTITLGQGRRPGTARASMSGNARSLRRAIPRQGGNEGPSQLRPFLLRLMDPEGDAQKD